MRVSTNTPAWIFRSVGWALFLSLVLQPDWFSPLWSTLNDAGVDPIYHADRVATLTLWHLALSLIATAVSTLGAVSLAIVVTRPSWSHERAFLESLLRLAQAIPPVVVLALVIPTLGFGNLPTLCALVLYGLLPIFERTVTGLEAVPQPVLLAARGMGMTDGQRLWRVELPLARPAILEGVRLSLTISIGTATLGSTVAAKSLGELILAGLYSNNNAYLVQGALICGLMAMLVYDLCRWLEQRWSVQWGSTAT